MLNDIIFILLALGCIFVVIRTVIDFTDFGKSYTLTKLHNLTFKNHKKNKESNELAKIINRRRKNNMLVLVLIILLYILYFKTK